MIKWAGWIIVLFGTAHTVSALTLEGAARHAGTWFSGGLWGDDFAAMSPADSAYWLSLSSFGIPLVLLGLTILWLDRQGIAVPRFLPWALGIWTVVDMVVLEPTPAPIMLLASVLLLLGASRATRPSRPRTSPAPH
ncbi:DUF6463 family protein [Nocardia terpenica]|uniref:Uncharacterized protein n=1 Tax=Nocardia terpenica TaxID=455432 RepID=A0A6G9Z801_9NOCA|nr:DUF6463 family protein [Nocardia terpenica]QIS21477.1 hypothetical protein F6W96_27225 [Nocardia terpenica]